MDKSLLKSNISNSKINFYDQTKEYYFDIDNTLIVEDKDKFSNIGTHNLLKLNMIRQPSKANKFLTQLLCAGGQDDLSFRFLIINLSAEFQHRLNDVLSLIEEMLGEIYSIIINDQLVIFHFDKYFFDFKSIIDTLIDDLGIDFEIFEGCKISKRADFFLIVRLYFKCLAANFYRYSTMTDLVLTIYEHNPLQLKAIKEIILEEILKDKQLVNLVKSLFENNLNISQSSAVVYMHRNTINNKLDLIKKISGFNIQNFKEAVAMYLLLNA